MAIAIDISQAKPNMTEREFLRAAGYSVGAKGRFNADHKKVIDLAMKAGYIFASPGATVKKAAKALVSQSEIDLLAFREWEVSKGYEVSERRISNERLNEYVTEVPDYKRREAVTKTARVAKVATPKVDRKSYDPAAVRVWAKAQGIDVNDRGKLSGELIGRYILAHKESGTVTPVRDSTENAFAPTPDRINSADEYVGQDIDGTEITRTYRDVSANGTVSIGWQPLPVYAWSKVDTDQMIELKPKPVKV